MGIVVDRQELDHALDQRLREIGKCQIYKDKMPDEVWLYERGV